MISEMAIAASAAFIEKHGEVALAELLHAVVKSNVGDTVKVAMKESLSPDAPAVPVTSVQPTRPGSSEMNEAETLVNGTRQSDYGSPAVNYEGIARVWSGLLAKRLMPGVVITPEEAALMMVGLKIQRQCMNPKRDNMVDAHGYLLVAAHCRSANG